MTLLPPGVKVRLALGYIDMRKGIDGLAMLVQSVLRHDPFSGHLFVFRGRPRRANSGHVSLDQLKVMSAIESCRTAAREADLLSVPYYHVVFTLSVHTSTANLHAGFCQACSSVRWRARTSSADMSADPSPSQTIRPPSRIANLSATAVQTARFCSTSSMDRPAPFNSRKISSRRSTMTGARPSVGSSRNRSVGPVTRG